MRHEFIAIISKPEIEVENNKIVKLLWIVEEPVLIQVENLGDEVVLLKNHLKKITLDPVTEKIIAKIKDVPRLKVQMTKVASHLQIAPLHSYLRGTHGQTRIFFF